MKIEYFWSSVFIFLAILSVCYSKSFSIDYDNNTFVKDGKPFRYISGSIHYFRVPSYHWEDRLRKMYAAGLDAVQVYVAWNVHEPQPGIYDFSGQQDLEEFIRIADKIGLLVILRAGPYICAEWEFGGFPAWLLKKTQELKLRTMTPAYIEPVDRWMNVLLPKMKPLLYSNGGPIIMVQVENEFGWMNPCDHNYTTHLKGIFRQNLGEDVVLFTTDPSSNLACGAIDGVFTTIDFGPGSNVTAEFNVMKQWNKNKGPLVNSEYYMAWYDSWGDAHATGSTPAIIRTLTDILDSGASVNMYMFEGGTNFGYMAGVHPSHSQHPTEYDYDAPLSEAGDITDRYHALRDVIGKYKTLPPGSIPPSLAKYAYGKVPLHYVATVTDLLPIISPQPPVMTSGTVPILSMEDIDQAHGFILYRTVLTQDYALDVLDVSGIKDRGYVLVDGVLQGVVDWQAAKKVNIWARRGQTLDIVVENQGRFCIGSGMDTNRKGIVSVVTLGSQPLTNWTLYSLNFTHVFQQSADALLYSRQPLSQPLGPAVFRGSFVIPESVGVYDTFLDTSGWFKGQAFINGFNLGRYWPVKGPQVTLYVPLSVLRPHPQVNDLVLVELERPPAPCLQASHNCFMSFGDTPIINSTSIPTVS